jgi:uncharacterized LabA/DUF88 family protein
VYFFTGEASGLKKRIALLIDGGFLDKKIPNKSKNPEIQAGRIVQAALACMDPVEEELYRIYYYHCPPYGRKAMDVAGNLVDSQQRQLLLIIPVSLPISPGKSSWLYDLACCR